MRDKSQVVNAGDAVTKAGVLENSVVPGQRHPTRRTDSPRIGAFLMRLGFSVPVVAKPDPSSVPLTVVARELEPYLKTGLTWCIEGDNCDLATQLLVSGTLHNTSRANDRSTLAPVPNLYRSLQNSRLRQHLPGRIINEHSLQRKPTSIHPLARDNVRHWQATTTP